MALPSTINLLLTILFFSTFLTAYAQTTTCSNYTFPSNRAYNSCIDLPYLEAHLHWTYTPSTRKLSVAYRAKQSLRGWTAWAINPTSTGMVGSQALVAFNNANGTTTVYPTSVISYNPSMQPGELSFPVSNISAEYSSNQMSIFAVIGPLENGTKVNHVWQAGSSVSSGVPQIHSTSPPNLQSMGIIDFESD